MSNETDRSNFEDIVVRSCWKCNPNHEYLKESQSLILCYECGHYFLRGIDITDQEEVI